ncbi:hypothetical protein HDV05_008481 [Chytridiales sp. JEL 0842]|nr:hypothetical protein HDV05_008481 [Chytridiales sp. JEL 0842]
MKPSTGKGSKITLITANGANQSEAIDSDSDGEYSPNAQRVADFDESDIDDSPTDTLGLTAEDELIYGAEDDPTTSGTDDFDDNDDDNDNEQDDYAIDTTTQTLLESSPLILQHASILLTRISKSLSIPFTKTGGLNFTHHKCIDNFESGSEWELSIRKGDHIVIASLTSDATNPTSSTNPKQQDRWASIVGSPSSSTSVNSSNKQGQEDRWASIIDSPSSSTSVDPPGKQQDRWASIIDSPSSSTSVDPEKQQDRWASIVDENDTNPPSPLKNGQLNNKKRVCIKIEPKSEDFLNQLKGFIDHQDQYGEGWLTGLKVRIRATKVSSSPQRSIKITLLDIGLIPDSYVASINSIA